MPKVVRASDMRIVGNVEPGFVLTTPGLLLLSDQDAAGLQWAWVPTPDVEPEPPPPERRLVPLAVIMMRLKLFGREQALLDLLNAPGNEHARDELMEQVEQGIYADDPQARTLIALAGADPDRVLA